MLQPVDDFFLTADFATEARYTDPSGVITTINVIFDEAYSETQVGSDVYQNTKPIARCKTTDVDGITTAARMKINDVNYYVLKPEPDILGVTTVVLSTDAI